MTPLKDIADLERQVQALNEKLRVAQLELAQRCLEQGAPQPLPGSESDVKHWRSVKDAVARAFDAIGIPTQERVGAEEVQRLIAADLRRRGQQPSDNSLSRELVAMREE
jgi:hypothetical protein